MIRTSPSVETKITNFQRGFASWPRLRKKISCTANCMTAMMRITVSKTQPLNISSTTAKYAARVNIRERVNPIVNDVILFLICIFVRNSKLYQKLKHQMQNTSFDFWSLYLCHEIDNCKYENPDNIKKMPEKC